MSEPTDTETAEHEFICEVCSTTATLTNADAYAAGWDYPPFIGSFGVVSPRTCPNCTMDETAWWALVRGIKPSELSEQQRATVQRILNESPR